MSRQLNRSGTNSGITKHLQGRFIERPYLKFSIWAMKIKFARRRGRGKKEGLLMNQTCTCSGIPEFVSGLAYFVQIHCTKPLCYENYLVSDLMRYEIC